MAFMTKTIPAALVAALVVATPTLGVAQTNNTRPLHVYSWKDKNGKIHYSDRLPPGGENILKDLNDNSKVDPVTSLKMRKAAAESPVTLYTAHNCTQLCNEARDLLHQRGVLFQEVSIKTPALKSDFHKRFGTDAVIPVLTVGATAVQGFDTSSWNKELDTAGYPQKIQVR